MLIFANISIFMFLKITNHHYHSRQFLLGSALLNMGEPEKACSWMVQAAGGIGSDSFLMNHLFGPDENLGQCSADRLTVMYFLKVIHLFEQFGKHLFIVLIAIARELCTWCQKTHFKIAKLVLTFKWHGLFFSFKPLLYFFFNLICQDLLKNIFMS